MKAPIDPISGTQSLIDWLIVNREGLILGAIVAAAIVAIMLIVRAIGTRIVERHPNCANGKGIVGSVLAKTGILFMLAVALEVVTGFAPVPPQVDRLVHIIFVVAAAFQVAVWARELIMGSLSHRVGDEPGESNLGNASAIIRVLVSVALFAIAIVVILDNLGVNVTALVAGLGIGGIAIGLAAQGIFSDLFAALAILFDKPFKRGDTIRFGTTVGTVEQIGLKTTRVRAQGGEQVIMSNKQLLDQEITNLAKASARRTWLPFAIVYHTAPELLERIPALAEEAVKAQGNCTMVRCVIKALGPSSIDFELVYDDRSIDFDSLAIHRSEILLELLRIFAREGVEFTYPTQTTYTAAPDGSLVMPYAQPQPAVPAKPKRKG